MNVFTHQRGGMPGSCTQSGDDLWPTRCIAKGNRHVPQPALVTDTPDGGSLRVMQELLLAPAEKE